jgi:diacylglycerol kinase family enzyme
MDETTVTVEGAASSEAEAQTCELTSHVRLERVTVLINPLSGSVGPRAAEEAEEILSRYACETKVISLEPGGFDEQIDAALKERPDALFVLAGDGTAGTVASRAGPDGPLVAPLPGGTMNMLPKALYGSSDWKTALKVSLEEGAAHVVAGGEVTDGDMRRSFFCAAIFGAPALWAPAREAIRVGKLRLAFLYARRALRRAFSGRLRYGLDNQPERRTEALVLISPMISRAVDEEAGLEAAAMNPADAGEAFRLAAHALFDDWRLDPAVMTRPARRIRVRARSRIPAVIDGEPVLLRHEASIAFLPHAFRALAPVPAAAEDTI